jgi:two-component system, cell cycle response regulator
VKILLADDDAVSRCLMERMLKRGGYQVVTAENGEVAARVLLSEDGPRLALMDWMMPELDGPDVCRQLRSRPDQPYVYITMLTSRQSRADVVAGLEAGADDYLVKPCDYQELRARLRTGERILELEDNLVEAREEMRFKATHDALTSLWDRGAIFAHLRSEIHRSIGNRAPFSLLLCDIDHFKAVNDTYGHLVGDEVLLETAARLRRAVRPCDMVGRYGGEEFLLILKQCDAVNIGERAEQVRHAVASAPFRTARGPLSVSASIGVLTLDGSENLSSPDALLGLVDAALYKAKAAGRNRVAYAEAARLSGTPTQSPMRTAPIKRHQRQRYDCPAFT